MSDLMVYFLNKIVCNIFVMKVFHIQQFKCNFCKDWFNPSYNLPYLLRCTHSICSQCLIKYSNTKSNHIICPDDHQLNYLTDIHLNQTTKRALERLMKEHKSYHSNTQLLCIQTLTQAFEDLLNHKLKQTQSYQQLIQQLFHAEINRLQALHQKIKNQINRPNQMVNDWKEAIKIYLSDLKNLDKNSLESGHFSELNHFVEEGRKIKIQLTEFAHIKFDDLANEIISNPSHCFNKNYSIFEQVKTLKEVNQNDRQVERKTMKMSKNQAQSKIPLERVRHHTPFNEVENTYHQFLKPNYKNQSPILKSKKYQEEKNHKNKQMQDNKENKFAHKNVKATNKQLSLNAFSLAESNQNQQISEEIQKTIRGQNHFNKCQYLNYPIITPSESKISKNSEINQNSNIFVNEIKKQEKHMINNSSNSNKNSNNNSNINKNNNKKGLLSYSPEQFILSQQSDEEQRDNLHEEMLLSDRQNEQNNWELTNINFLKEWELDKEEECNRLEVKKKEYYNCEKQKNNYVRRMDAIRTEHAKEQTSIEDNLLELINYSLQDVDMKKYLEKFNWNAIEVVKLVNTGLSDLQFNQLLNFILHSNVVTLVLTGNSLNQISLDALLHFVTINSQLKNVYLQKNNISNIKAKIKIKIAILKQKGINIYS